MMKSNLQSPIWRPILLGVLSVFLVAGANPIPQEPRELSQPREQIKLALDANQKAGSLQDWQESDFHPDRIAQGWIENKIDGQTLCSVLTSVATSELQVFEASLEDHFTEKTLPCKSALTKKMAARIDAEVNQYYEEHFSLEGAETLGGPGQKFDALVVPRDFRNGYRTIRADLEPNQIMFTFDDGPHRENTPEILRTLDERGVGATFFMLGKNVLRYPDLVREVEQGGHVVGSHSFTHRQLSKLSYSEAIDEIVSGHNAVAKVLGFVDPFFRFPYGSSTKSLQDFLAKNQLGSFFWTVDTLDWKIQTIDQLVKETVRLTLASRGGIILMHDVQARTAKALPFILDQLYNKKMEAVKIQPITNRPQPDMGFVE